MIRPGLVSITFRQLKPDEIVKLVVKAGLTGIEWGGDVHVPHGNIGIAKDISRMTIDSGLVTAAYGSYYKVGFEDKDFDTFKRIVETAVELRAPTIRVWAGEKGSYEADDKYREKVVMKTKYIAELAGEAGISVSFEFHGGTLTDTNESAQMFFEAVNHDQVKSYWQPNQFMSFGQRFDGLKMIYPLLTNIHVFQWTLVDQLNVMRHPLSDGEAEWKTYFRYINGFSGNHYAMIEFVKNNEPQQFLQDAAVLKSLINDKA